MRAGLATALAATGLALVLSGCGGGSDTANSGPDCTVPGPRPAVALLAEPASQPTARAQICELATDFRNVVMEPAWDAAAKALLAVNHDVGLWQRRTLLLACTGCRSSGLDLAQVRDDHPQWILHDSAGREVHLVGHPDQVLLDFGDPDYQASWQEAVGQQLGARGYIGVVVTDARNDLQLSSVPIDPRTGQPMTDDDRARYLAEALALARGALKTDGFSLVAENEPPTVIDEAQIGSTDAVIAQDGGGGFAGRRGGAWDELFAYYQAAVARHVGAWVTTPAPPTPAACSGWPPTCWCRGRCPATARPTGRTIPCTRSTSASRPRTPSAAATPGCARLPTERSPSRPATPPPAWSCRAMERSTCRPAAR